MTAVLLEVVGRIVAFLLGAGVLVAVLGSALRTVVVPRDEPSFITQVVFVGIRRLFYIRIRKLDSWDAVDRRLARYAPVALLVLPAVWMTVMVLALTPMFWALGSAFPREAFTRSGSSLLTLGFAFAKDLPETVLSFAAATIGLGLVALLISFLPSIYAQFSRREVLVAQMDVRAGTPPDPVVLLTRANAIGLLSELDALWREWERWFLEVDESHSSNGALPFFRSQHPERSWLTAGACVLDGAALRASCLELPRSVEAQLCLRAGFLTLRSLADVFGIPYDPAPQPGDPVSIARDEFDVAFDRLAAAGLPMVADHDQAWLDYAGWRVNYDEPLLGLCELIVAPVAPWSSDRGSIHHFRTRRRPSRR